MIEAIQRSCYLDARNPDIDTLIDLVAELGIDRERFPPKFRVKLSKRCCARNWRSRAVRLSKAFPRLVIRTEAGLRPVDVDFHDAAAMRTQIEAIVAAADAR